MRSPSAKHFSSISPRAFSTASARLASNSIDEYCSTQLLTSGDPTATKEFLKIQHDDHAGKTAASLSRLTKDLRNASFLLPTLTDSLTHIKPPKSAPIKRSIKRYEIASPIRPDSIPPYIVQPWRASVGRAKDWTVLYAGIADKLRLHIQDLKREPFPSDVTPSRADQILDSVKGMDDDAKNKELREGEMKMLAVKARLEAQITRLKEGVQELRRRNMTDSETTGGSRKDDTQEQTSVIETLARERMVARRTRSGRSGQRETGRERNERRRRRRLKSGQSDSSAERMSAKEKSTHVPTQVNEDGSIKFTPLAAPKAEEKKINGLPTQGWGASAPKQVKTESIGIPNPFAKTNEDVKEAEGSKPTTSKGWLGFGKKVEQAAEVVEKDAAPAAAEPPKEKTNAKSGLLAQQAALEKSVLRS